MRRVDIRRPVALVTCVTFLGGMLPTRRVSAADEAQGEERVEASAKAETAEVKATTPAATTAAPSSDRGVPVARDQNLPVNVAAVPTSEEPPAPIRVDSLAVGGDKTGVSSQAISLPQGSGKIQGMGESFSTQLSTGVATFSVPISLPKARGGAQPSLSLSYSSASGHGVAGVGFDIGVPYIARQTDRGLPTYNDQSTWQPQQDRFVFNGGQELVPICTVTRGQCDGALRGVQIAPGQTVDEQMPAWAEGWQYFRARVEGSYLRFFWSKDHNTWRVQSKTGESMELGVPLDGSGYTTSLETDPNNPAHIFRWNLVRQYDNQGSPPPGGATNPLPVNIVAYRYENVGGMDYLTDIYDTPPAPPGANPTTAPLTQYAHHTVLRYETRPDTTFTYRRGWRVDQTLRLIGIDVASKPFLGGPSSGSGGTSAIDVPRHQVRRYHLAYDPNYHVSLLTQVQMEGRCAGSIDINGQGGETQAPAESSELLPATTNCGTLRPITLGYQHVTPYNVDGSPGSADLTGYEGFDERPIFMSQSPPNSIDEQMTDLFDINADGLPDVVVTFPGSDAKFPMYLNSLGGTPNSFGGSELGVMGVLGATSSGINLSNDNVAVLDIDGDGIIDWLHQPMVKQYAVYTPQLLNNAWWMVGRAVPQSANQDPHLDLGEDTPDINVFDVNGDGLVDVVRTTGTELQTFFSLGRYPGGDGNFGSATWTGPYSANLSLQFMPSCVPLVSPGLPIRFSDPQTRLGDMNGDGLQDLVYVQQGNIQYWPGRGDGSFGTAALGSCTSGFAQNTAVAMTASPWYSDPSGSGVRIDDVNGDGLDDLVQVEFNAIEVWLNVDGKSWTQEHIIQNVQPASGPQWADKVRLVDMNGSGTRDVLWGEGGNYRFMDLSGGKQPWVLTHIDNGLGKTTDIDYSTSTAQMLAAEAGGKPWTSRAPMPLHVVATMTDHDNLQQIGMAGGNYVTHYTYRDPVYDGRQREFRGFRTTVARKLGDANSPTSSSSSEFLLGECVDDEPPPGGLTSRCIPAGRWADNGREALKGLPVVTESFDDDSPATYLSTTHTQYTLRKLYTGQDGREVRVAFASQSDTWNYDTAGFVAASGSPGFKDVVLDHISGTDPSTTLPAFIRSTAGVAHIQSASVVDMFGNAIRRIESGCVDGDGCLQPTGQPGKPDQMGPDEVITSVTTPEPVPGDTSGWLWRPKESYVQGSIDTVVRQDTSFSYDQNGNETLKQAQLAGTLSLDRFHETTGASTAGPPPNASGTGSVTLSQTTYGSLGEVQSQASPNGRCRDISYASDYLDLPTIEILYAGVPDGTGATCLAGGGPRGVTPLHATAAYDRGESAAINIIDMHNEPSLVTYDEFARFSSLTKPSAEQMSPTTALSRLPAIAVDYTLTSAGHPYSVVHTSTFIGATEGTNSYRNTYVYVDGFERPLVTQDEADPDAGDGGQWIIEGLTTHDAKGAEERKYLASFWNGKGGAYAFAQSPSIPYQRQLYDPFGRLSQTFGLDGALTLQSTYHALSVDKADAADLAPGPHQGTPSTARTDGHGRSVVLVERIHNGNALEARETQTIYLATGEPTIITRVRDGASDPAVVRWLQYDTLGRVVLNVEPDTSTGFVGPPLPRPGVQPPPSTLKAWRYAYDDSGELVGISDARGCGANFYYDLAGRILAEDFSPCLNSQPTYSTPTLANGFPTGDNTEAFYLYDSLDNDASLRTIPNFPIDESALRGRLIAVSDRGAKTVTRYDARGRTTGVARLLPKPGTPADILANRYALGTNQSGWFSKSTAYDGADRPVSISTGADGDFAPGGQSFVTTTYTKRGTIGTVGSSYGELVTNIKRDADERITQTAYGDAAATTTALSYDSRRRVSSIQTYRGAPAIWSTTSAGISPPPDTNPNDPPTTLQLLLEDLDYHYDEADNPTEIDDFRNPAEWPSGAAPVGRKVEFDDLYRVTRFTYQYPSGVDGWVSPFSAEDTGTNIDPRRSAPSPHVAFTHRVQWQSFQYDWLGNTKFTDDDAHGFYDRSLGTIINGTAAAAPYQLRAASAGGSLGGSLGGVGYDASGNLTGLTLSRSGPCLPSGSSCSQQFRYDWDEVGRLVHATRFDGGSSAAAAELQYAYDENGVRTLKTAIASNGTDAYDAYVFDSLELRHAVYDDKAGEYVRDDSSEVPYLFAHGLRLGRVHYALASEPTLTSGRLHVLFELPDHIGSTTIVIDKDTSELVERSAYMAYGAADSDYRPVRWSAFREDYRFTGKEEDVAVGLQYFGKRYYDPHLGRWLSADPLAIHQLGADANAYAYVHGRVASEQDPQGLQEMWSMADGLSVDLARTEVLKAGGPAAVKEFDEAYNRTRLEGTAAGYAAVACIFQPGGCARVVTFVTLAGSENDEDAAERMAGLIVLDGAFKLVGGAAGRALGKLSRTGIVQRGAAAFSRIVWRMNAPGVIRNLSQAIELAQRAGVEWEEENFKFVVAKPGELAQDVGAQYTFGRGEYYPDDIIRWDQINKIGDKILIKINPNILGNDEKIVWTFAHEMFELESLENVFRKNGWAMRAEDLMRHIETSSGSNLHGAAVTYADDAVMEYRAGQPPEAAPSTEPSSGSGPVQGEKQ